MTRTPTSFGEAEKRAALLYAALGSAERLGDEIFDRPRRTRRGRNKRMTMGARGRCQLTAKLPVVAAGRNAILPLRRRGVQDSRCLFIWGRVRRARAPKSLLTGDGTQRGRQQTQTVSGDLVAAGSGMLASAFCMPRHGRGHVLGNCHISRREC